ncbi:MAG: YqaJ viral recombinase family protein [Patescibacteria group bacterium]
MITRSIFETKEEWSKDRSGLFTASRINELLTEPKNKSELISQSAKSYVMETVGNLLAPPEPNIYSQAMEHGNETEPQAVLAFANKHGLDVNADDFIYTSVGGFVFFQDKELGIGGTPDIIIKDAIVEIKCPNSKTHLKYLLIENQNEIPKEYYAQMQLNMYLTGRKKGYFVSFDDRYYDEKHHLKEVEVNYDSEFMDHLFKKTKLALDYKNEIINKLN